jgi:mediator of RNA polymerase II transcription subunit 23
MPTQSSTLDQSTITHASTAKPTDVVGTSNAAANSRGTGTPMISQPCLGSLRQLCCKIILSALETNPKPLIHGVIFQHMIDWLVNWNQRPSGMEESIDSIRSWGLDTPLHEWMHLCLDVVWILVDEDKCQVPFYEHLRGYL